MASHYGQLYGGYIVGSNVYGHGGFINNQTQTMQMAGGPAGYPSRECGARWQRQPN